MPRRRYFTVDEANQQVPRLEAGFRRMLEIRARLKTLYRSLEERGFAPEDEHFEVAAVGARHDVLRDRAGFKGLIEALRDEISALRAIGCVLKDLDVGVVDWPARGADGRDVLLCWRFGEKEVGFWHDQDAGDAGRRPISELAARRTVKPST